MEEFHDVQIRNLERELLEQKKQMSDTKAMHKGDVSSMKLTICDLERKLEASLQRAQHVEDQMETLMHLRTDKVDTPLAINPLNNLSLSLDELTVPIDNASNV